MAKKCVDCKYATRRLFGLIKGGEFAECTRQPEDVDFVTGEKDYYFCSTQRECSWLCGPDAKWFEPR